MFDIVEISIKIKMGDVDNIIFCLNFAKQYENNNRNSSNGVMLNAYPDSIGTKLSDIVAMLQMADFKDVFSLIYPCLPVLIVI
jgi:hypothetical protein